MKPVVRAPDAEELVGDILDDLLTVYGETYTIGNGVPTTWSATSDPHVQVVWDGTPTMEWPVTTRPTIRVVVRAGDIPEAKRLAAVCQGLLLAHMGGDGVTNIRPGSGILPARDPETQAEIAWFTVIATVRNVPIDAGS